MTRPRIASPRPDGEAERQAAFDAMGISHAADPVLDGITGLAALICQMPMSLLTLIDGAEARPKSAHGLKATTSARDDSFCAHTVMDPDSVMLVPDARRDPVFHSYPAVEGDLALRSYAGVPLMTRDGFAVGALCVFGNEPHRFTDVQVEYLRLLGRMAQLRLAE